MQDLMISLDHRPGALAEMGEALGRAGVSIEGGGAWVVGGVGVAHFLFADGDAARKALEAELANALSRATTYAYQRGVTVIASAGNDAFDLDHTGNLISVPAQSTHTNTIAATGPVGFAVGYPNGATNFDRPASYTNFGQSAIDFSAPGGDFVLPGNANCTLPRIPAGSVIAPCWVFDMVISPASIPATGGYSFAAGTSMAAPHVTGVAALIIEANGGSMHPALVEAALRSSADDAGNTGHDAYHGSGFVNALRAVTE
jgi:subtilisin family serine protease